MRGKAALAFVASLILGSGLLWSEPEDTIKIGVYGPFSGGSAPLGVSMRNGIRLAAEELNREGGVLGRQIVLVERDDEAKNELGGQIMQELLEKEKVAAVLGPVNTGVADASTRYANFAKVPQIIAVSAGAKVNELFADSPENYIFRFSVSDNIQARLAVREAVRRGHRKPALLCDDTNYGQGGRQKMEAALKELNLHPVYVGKFKLKDTDMTAQLQDAKAAGADSLLVYGIGPELAAISNNMERIGWRVDILGSWTLSMSNYINNAGKNGNGATMAQTFIESAAKSQREQHFLADYHAKFPNTPIPSAIAAAHGYDSMNLLALAIQQAASLDGAKIKSALEDLRTPYDGLTGRFVRPYSATDHEAFKESNVRLGMVQDGQVIAAVQGSKRSVAAPQAVSK